MTGRPRLLILSFSTITRDARVLKQVRLFRDDYDVITCAFGDAPDGVAEHVRIPDGLSPSRPYGRWLTLKQYRLAYWRQDGVRWVRAALAGVAADAVIANDVEAVPLAVARYGGDSVHADLHEYSPRMREERPNWRRRVGRYLDWMCRRYVARAASSTTVSPTIADEYAAQFGFRPGLVVNAAPYAELTPTEAAPHGDVRFVHSGACMPHRGLEQLVDALALTRSDATLDLFLVPNDAALLDRLRVAAQANSRLRLHDAVAYDALIEHLNVYDVGIHVLPPANFNHRNALPNKVFDFVQARLGVLTGPTPPMAMLVRKHSLGWVADDFTPEAIARAMDAVDREGVRRAKAASHSVARELAAENQMGAWADAIAALAPTGRLNA